MVFSSNHRNKILQGFNWWKKTFDQPVKIDLRTYDKIVKTATGQGDDYATCFLLNYPYFEKHYTLIGEDLGIQQKLAITIQQIN